VSLLGRSVHEISAVRTQGVLEKDIEVKDVVMIHQTKVFTFVWLECGVEQSPRVERMVVGQDHEK
jgi:hypothetical protein